MLLARNPTALNLFVLFLFFSFFILTILYCFRLLCSLGGSSFVHSFTLLLSNLPLELLFGSRTHPLLSPTILFHFKSFFCQLKLGLTMLHIQFLYLGSKQKIKNTQILH